MDQVNGFIGNVIEVQAMKDRLAELETRVAFQDDTLLKLNDVVARQQQQLDQLRLELEQMRVQLKDMAPSPVASQSQETPPPHY